jgi:acyl-CoA synthetase (AMP-forming)/AMP-acid ligase II
LLTLNVGGQGAVLHTINPRLHPDLLAYVINHAEDKVLFVDLTFYKGASALMPKLPSLKALVVMTDKANMPEGVASNVLCYEDMIASESQEYAWPKLDENIAAALCYTSGTTGNPKVSPYPTPVGLAIFILTVFALSGRAFCTAIDRQSSTQCQ